MRIELQILSGIVLGAVILVGLSGLRRVSRSASIVPISHQGGSSLVGGSDVGRATDLRAVAARQVSEDVESARKSESDELELIERGSPLELMINGYTRVRPEESLAVQLLQRHRQIRESPDEPAWSRDAERKLWEMIALSPEGPALEVASIMCRSAGCEVQVFANSESSARAWSGLKASLAQAIPGNVLVSTHQSSSGGRAISIAFLARESSANDPVP